jgi:hypothetical protein
MPLDALIDGPLQTDGCGRRTPSGPAWAVFPDHGTTGHLAASFIRFALIEDQSKTIDIINAHPNAGQEEWDLPVVWKLIAEVGPPPYADSRLYYPTLLAGDFNRLTPESFGRFNTVLVANDRGAADGAAVGIGIAAIDSVPAQYRPRAAERIVMPDLPTNVPCPGPGYMSVSDHCGVFVRFEWDGPTAGNLRGVFLDGPTQVITGEPYSLQATPSGGGPNYSYRWEPSGGTTPTLNAHAGPAGVTQVWTVTVTDRSTGRTQTAQRAVTALRDDRRCEGLCQEELNACMACVGPGCSRPQQCIAAYRACVKSCHLP